MHTENINATDIIRAALVAQLAKPQVEPTAWWVATRTAQAQLLTWVGIVGGAISLFTNLRGVLTLADWARWIVQHWHDWSQALWVMLFGWIGVHIPVELAPTLSFVLFMSLLLAGTMLRSKAAVSRAMLAGLAKRIGLYSIGAIVLVVAYAMIRVRWIPEAYDALATLIVSLLPVFPFVVFTAERLQRLAFVGLLALSWITVVFVPTFLPWDVVPQISDQVAVILLSRRFSSFQPERWS
jgi:hypothetical protein